MQRLILISTSDVQGRLLERKIVKNSNRIDCPLYRDTNGALVVSAMAGERSMSRAIIFTYQQRRFIGK